MIIFLCFWSLLPGDKFLVMGWKTLWNCMFCSLKLQSQWMVRIMCCQHVMCPQKLWQHWRWTHLFFFFCFLGLHSRHVEVPRLGVNRSYSGQPMPQPQQHQIQATSSTHTTAHCNAGSLTHWVRPGFEPLSSWLLVRFVNHWATMRTPGFLCVCMFRVLE